MSCIFYLPRFSIYFLLLLSLAFSSACNEVRPPSATAEPSPTLLPKDTPTPFATATTQISLTTETPNINAPTPIPAWFEGVFVDLPESLDQQSITENVAGQFDSELPAGERYPDHTQLLFDEWPLDTLIERPRILAFPARDYSSVNVLAQIEIDQLKDLIDSTDPLKDEENLPFLPVTTRPQLLKSLPKHLPFQSGEGLRYLTLFLADNNSGTLELLYTWQGLTNDGRGVVSAVFPIKIDGIPTSAPSGSQAVLSQWTEELSSSIEQLPSEAFEPSLEELDQIVSSIYANLPKPELIFDENGKVDLTIVYPRSGGETIIGRMLELEGYLQPGTEHEVELLLKAGTSTLAAQTITSELDGSWQAILSIPENVRGNVLLTAAGNNQIDEVSLNLVDDPFNRANSIIDLTRPSAEETVYAGYPIYLEGSLSGELVDDQLSVGILINQCQTLVAKQDLTLLPGSNRWHAMLLIPQGLSGQSCSIAWTGTYGEEQWREVQVPITISNQLPESAQIVFGNPINDPITLGSTSTIFGVAISDQTSSINSDIQIKINLQDGTLVSEGIATLETSGLWNYEFDVPSSATGRLFVEASFSDGPPANNIITLPLVSQ